MRELTWTAILDSIIACISLERRKVEEITRWKRRVSKTLVSCVFLPRLILMWKCRVQNPQNQSDLQSKLSYRFWPPCAKCTACAKCSELGVQIRGWCTFSRLRLTGEFCLSIRIRWCSMVRCTFSRVLIFAGTPAPHFGANDVMAIIHQCQSFTTAVSLLISLAFSTICLASFVFSFFKTLTSDLDNEALRKTTKYELLLWGMYLLRLQGGFFESRTMTSTPRPGRQVNL